MLSCRRGRSPSLIDAIRVHGQQSVKQLPTQHVASLWILWTGTDLPDQTAIDKLRETCTRCAGAESYDEGDLPGRYPVASSRLNMSRML